MTKPTSIRDYDPFIAEMCERALVTLIYDCVALRNSIYLVGGLVPRYLIKSRPPDVPMHAGTQDVDLLVDTKSLADANIGRKLTPYLKGIGFERGENDEGKKLSYRWQFEHKNAVSFLEFLVNSGDASARKIQSLTPIKDVSAQRIPRTKLVFNHCECSKITAKLLKREVDATVTVRHADIVSFTCLKAFAFKRRKEPKDAYDLCYCLEHYEGGADAFQTAFRQALKGSYRDNIECAIDILKTRFRYNDDIERCHKNGVAAAACFESAEEWTDSDHIERRRALSDIVQRAIAPFLLS